MANIVSKKKIIFFLAIFCLTFVLFTGTGLAQEIEYIDLKGAETPNETSTLPSYIIYLFNLAIVIGGLLAFAILVYSGFIYLTSSGNPIKINEAKSKIFNAIIGILLLLSAYLILTTINPNLVILEFNELNWPEINWPDPPPPPPPPPGTISVYQELPMGILIENVLAKNTDCYDYDEDGNMADLDEITPDKIDVLENHDRLNCIKKLFGAVKAKSENLKSLSEELKDLSKGLKEKSEELKDYADQCSCANCIKSCRGCGCKNSISNCSCSGDPCAPNRDKMENLRNNIIPLIIENINKKKDEIRSLVYGADPLKDLYYYDELMDPNITSTFLTLEEALLRINNLSPNDELKKELTKDLNYLKDAEELGRYKEKITLAELYLKQKTEITQKLSFEGFQITNYCRGFNCIKPEVEEGICVEYGLNAEGKLCNIYNNDDEPATFYFFEKEIKEE